MTTSNAFTKANPVKRKAVFDGIGYVNGNGASKYWGVTWNSQIERWVVSIQFGYRDAEMKRPYNRLFYFNGCKGTEEHAAQIAAALYPIRGQMDKLPKDDFVVTTTDLVQYTVSTAHNSITRKTMRKGVVPTVNTLPIPEDVVDGTQQGQEYERKVVEFKKPETKTTPTQSELPLDSRSRYTEYEYDLMMELFDAYNEGKLSIDAINMLKKITHIMDS